MSGIEVEDRLHNSGACFRLCLEVVEREGKGREN